MKFWLLASLLLVPQAERITIRLAPSPDQVVRMRASQQVTLTSEPQGAAGSTPATAISMNSSLDYTMTTGGVNEQGRYEARIVCDAAEAAMTVNGQSMALPFSQAAGAMFTVAYDANRMPVEVTGGSESGATAMARQILQDVLGQSATLVMAVGETITRPVKLSLPMPGPPAADSRIAVDTMYTLQSVTSAGGARIAHLAISSTAAFSPQVPGASSATLEMRMSGTGTLDVDVDRGLSTASAQVMAVDGLMTPGSSAAAGSPMRLHGTVKSSTRIID